MKKYMLTVLIALSINIAFAQDFFDALRYSQTQYGGSARSIAMGSAFGALGGDFVSASINPAGLGLYRSGEFSISPTLNLNQMLSTYLGNSETDNKYNFNFNNMSYVATAKTGMETGIVSLSFGVGFNRLKNFNSNSYIQGFNAKTTLLNYFTDYANGSNYTSPGYFDPHYEGLAWNTWLIDEDLNPDVKEGIYYNDLTNYQSYDIVDENNNVIGIGYEATDVKAHQQKNSMNNSGHLDEYLLSLGVNVNHKVYFGASLGLVDLEYNQNTHYSEIDNNNLSEYLNNYVLDTYLSESGMGVNFKAGIIFRPSKSLRFGAAFHTPTFYSISKDEYKKMTANYDKEIGNDATGYSATWVKDNDRYYDYNLETPLKFDLSAAYSIGDVALISLDYEIINFAGAKLRSAESDNYDYSDQNSDINKLFVTTGNIRLGGEYRLTPSFSLRAGYNLYGNPWGSSYTASNGTPSEILNKTDTFAAYTGGFGYRQKSFFIDFAYRLNQNNYTQKVHEIYYTNPEGGSATADIKEFNNQTTITFGFRF